MPIRHLLSLTELGSENLARLVDRSVELAGDGVVRPGPLNGKVVGVYFKRPSTRTRTSFTSGALRLGAQVVSYGPDDLQITTGETLEDTARVLACYLDALVVRTNEPLADMRALAVADMPVINAMSVEEHPTQAIADLSTLKACFGRLDGVHVLYLGEGNNSTSALAFAVAQTPGMRLTIVTPEGYGLPLELTEQAARMAESHGASVEWHHRADDLPKSVDAVYATRWQTMGVSKPDPDWKDKFWPYSVTSELMARVSKADGSTIFLHDLPAVRGDDVTDEVLDGPQSWAWKQAGHKLFGAMAVLEWCCGGGPEGKTRALPR